MLPPNPYVRQPIRERRHLAGRSEELGKIGYYLALTASGQSPHLALVGRRGIGKTSLLNASERLASEKALLAVRLDLTEGVVATEGRFWSDFYSALIVAAATEGCWGGTTGPIYRSLLLMMHARQQADADHAVLQFPMLLASHRGALADLACADPIVVADLQRLIRDELSVRGVKGLAVLVDEADCLGRRVPLLQTLRNVFQRVTSASLVFAGTDAIFPALSEIFSPIPRQFHRIDVKPLGHVADTAQLIRSAMPPGGEGVLPAYDEIESVHELCGGDPSELQLYCHHMYRQVELEGAPRMELTPAVFRAVTAEYRSSFGGETVDALKRIEALPEDLLWKSVWLRRRGVSLDENVRIETVRLSLQAGVMRSASETAELGRAVRSSYEQLYALGVSKSDSALELNGEPVASGFWKAYVESVRDRRWRWDNGDVRECLEAVVTSWLIETVKPLFAVTHPSTEARLETRCALDTPGTVTSVMPWDAVVFYEATSFARDEDKTSIADIQVECVIGGELQSTTTFVHFGEDRDASVGTIRQAIATHAAILGSEGIEMRITSDVEWPPLTDEQVWAVSQLSSMAPPARFGEGPMHRALELFNSGDVAGAASTFDSMIKVSPLQPTVLNNSGYCLTLLGKPQEGMKRFQEAASQRPKEALFQHNIGVAHYLLGDSAMALQSLQVCELLCASADPERLSEVFCMLIVERTSGVRSIDGLPIRVAALINQTRLGALDTRAAKAILEKEFPQCRSEWSALLSEASA